MGIKRALLQTAVTRLRDSRQHNRDETHAEPEMMDRVLDIMCDLLDTVALVQELTKDIFLERAEQMFGDRLGMHGARAVGRTAFEFVNQFVF